MDASISVETAIAQIKWREIPEIIRYISLSMNHPAYPSCVATGILRLGPYELSCFQMADGTAVVDLQDTLEILKMCEALADFENIADIRRNRK